MNMMTAPEHHKDVPTLNFSLLNLAKEPEKRHEFYGIIGASAPMQSLYSTILKIAPSSASVMIQGESGTGKELVARAIHRCSDRANKPFRAINCAAIPADLLESELFGHKKGAFTGADSRHIGMFEASNGGTIFLDEIGDMPSSLQPKLLRVLQDSKVRPVGDNDEIEVDVRIIAATHENLEQLVEGKKFRDDLYFRINVIPLFVPSLRDRTEDLGMLISHFVKRFAKLYSKSVDGVSRGVLEAFAAYGWPGNVRELENSIERSVLLSNERVLGVEDFLWILNRPHAFASDVLSPSQDEGMFRIPLNVSLKELEDCYIKAYCKAHPNLSQEEVACGLGINRKTLYRKSNGIRQNS